MSKNFSFIRVVPIKNLGKGASRARSRTGRGWGLTGCAAHDLRFLDTPNANPKMLSKNAIVCEKTDWKPVSASKENLSKLDIHGPEYLAELAREKIAEKQIKVRKNQVLADVLLCAVSPEFLRDGDPNGKFNNHKVMTWAEGTIKYAREKYGDSLLSIMIHLDESNPHATVYLVPMLEKEIKVMGRPVKGMENQPRETETEWRLTHTDLFTRDKRILETDPITNEKKLVRVEKGTCSQMQDEYAEALQAMGLDVQRGIRKSDEEKALAYETLKERYRRLANTIRETERLTDAELRGWIKEKAPVVANAERDKKERDHYQIAAGSLQQKNKKLEEAIAKSKRKLPVGEVISKLFGIDPLDPDDDPKGKKRKDIQLEFLLPSGQRIGINSKNGFENLTPEIPFVGKHANRHRGTDALDAIQFLTGWEFKAASEWIADNFDNDSAGTEIAQRYINSIQQDTQNDERLQRKDHAETVTRSLETPDTFQWDSTLNTLTKTFKFREDNLERLHDDNWIEANCHGHFVFQKARWDKDNDLIPTGKIIVDPKNPTVTLKETGDNGLFFEIDKDANQVVICSSPMDALAIRSNANHYTDTVAVVGGSPTEATKKAIEKFIRSYKGNVVLAENLTAAGRKLATWIAETFPEIKTLPLPIGFRTWLDHHQRPRLHSDPADLRIVRTQKEIDEKNREMGM